jgi:hypothetical protein
METSKKGPCYSWINTGNCANKDSCPYHHKKLCTFFQNGSCRNGDECTYLHPKSHQKTERQAPFHHSQGQNAQMMQLKKENEKLKRETEKLKEEEAKRKERETNKKINEQDKKIEKLSRQLEEQKISNLEDRHQAALKFQKTQGQIQFGMQMVESGFKHVGKEMKSIQESTTKSIENSSKNNKVTVIGHHPLLALPYGIRSCRHGAVYPHCGSCGSASYRYAHCSHGYHYGYCPYSCSSHLLYCH